MGKKNNSQHMTLGETAKALDISYQTLKKKIDEGVIKEAIIQQGKRGVPWKVDVSLAFKEYMAHSGGKVGSDSTSAGITELDTPMTLTDARTKKEIFKAKKEEIEYLEAAGNLVPRKDVEKAAYDAGRQFRDGLLNLPARISQELFELESVEDVENVLNSHLYDLVREITDG